ncbi:MAG: 4-(cytidine 5'-diphospho)-2-C-methyl-D-erythritol kinase [Clostridia bacterium]|nr:4-(cytidine 5'-diphospho)-2-C-methyl-D-erythritol kinase [Clostridia bacterium]
MNKVTVRAHAKINLLLDITGTLPNGYHGLHMIMQSVSLCDTVTVERGAHALECSDPAVPTDARNIVWKAANAFEKATGIDCTDTRITIDKRIPSAAGLAGGSADGAAVLAALNRLHGTDLSAGQLCRIGAAVGADVPFCLTGGTCLALNIGDVLAPLPAFEGYTLVLAKPDCGVSTAEAYAAFDQAIGVSHPHFTQLLFDAAKGDWPRVFRGTCNTFEQFVEVVDRVPIKSVMRRSGSLFSMMSGSGPTVFGVFRTRAEAESCAGELQTQYPHVFVCDPVPYGLQIETK